MPTFTLEFHKAELVERCKVGWLVFILMPGSKHGICRSSKLAARFITFSRLRNREHPINVRVVTEIIAARRYISAARCGS
jgi:hypothetical protein